MLQPKLVYAINLLSFQRGEKRIFPLFREHFLTVGFVRDENKINFFNIDAFLKLEVLFPPRADHFLKYEMTVFYKKLKNFITSAGTIPQC